MEQTTKKTGVKKLVRNYYDQETTALVHEYIADQMRRGNGHKSFSNACEELLLLGLQFYNNSGESNKTRCEAFDFIKTKAQKQEYITKDDSIPNPRVIPDSSKENSHNKQNDL